MITINANQNTDFSVLQDVEEGDSITFNLDADCKFDEEANVHLAAAIERGCEITIHCDRFASADSLDTFVCLLHVNGQETASSSYTFSDMASAEVIEQFFRISVDWFGFYDNLEAIGELLYKMIHLHSRLPDNIRDNWKSNLTEAKGLYTDGRDHLPTGLDENNQPFDNTHLIEQLGASIKNTLFWVGRADSSSPASDRGSLSYRR